MTMWKVLPGTGERWEPLELRVLKRHLANLQCGCRTCTKQSPPGSQYDVGVQAKHSGVLDRFIQVTPKNSFTVKPKDSNQQFKQPVCPSCYITYTLLRCGGSTRIVKDEELDTIGLEKLTSNKSTEYVVCSVERATSVTNKPVLKFSNLNIDSDSSQTQSDRTGTGSNPMQKCPSLNDRNDNNKSHREVTFLVDKSDNFIQLGEEQEPETPPPPQDILRPLRESVTLLHSDEQYEPDTCFKKNHRNKDEPYVGPLYRTCMCADELIRTIRPPLTQW